MFSYGSREKTICEFIITEVNRVYFGNPLIPALDFKYFDNSLDQKSGKMFYSKGENAINHFRFSDDTRKYIDARFNYLEGLASAHVYTYLLIEGCILSSDRFNTPLWEYCEKRITEWAYGYYHLFGVMMRCYTEDMRDPDFTYVMRSMAKIIGRLGPQYIREKDLVLEIISAARSDYDLNRRRKDVIINYLQIVCDNC